MAMNTLHPNGRLAFDVIAMIKKRSPRNPRAGRPKAEGKSMSAPRKEYGDPGNAPPTIARAVRAVQIYKLLCLSYAA